MHPGDITRVVYMHPGGITRVVSVHTWLYPGVISAHLAIPGCWMYTGRHNPGVGCTPGGITRVV